MKAEVVADTLDLALRGSDGDHADPAFVYQDLHMPKRVREPPAL